MAPSVFSELLMFIYSGKVSGHGLQARPEALLAAAASFRMPRLVAICARHLANALSARTLVGVLLLADDYQVEPLKEHCFAWVRAFGLAKLLQRESYHRLEERPSLAKELLEALVGRSRHDSSCTEACRDLSDSCGERGSSANAHVGGGG